jgi:hypothetical protein
VSFKQTPESSSSHQDQNRIEVIEVVGPPDRTLLILLIPRPPPPRRTDMPLLKFLQGCLEIAKLIMKLIV